MATPTTNRISYGNSSLYALDEMSRSDKRGLYGLRRLVSTATKAIRVRESGSNAEMDIGFSGTGLDIAKLLAFCGSNSGYVVTKYDQSGNGNNATQTNANYQPRIVNAGILDRDFDASKCASLYPTFASAASVTLVSNGNFVNTTGWTAITNGTIAASDNTLSMTGSGTYYQDVASGTFVNPGVIGRRYFVRIKARMRNADCLSIALSVKQGGTSIVVSSQSSPVADQWYTISGVVALVSTSSAIITLLYSYGSGVDITNKVMEVQEVVCVDVTDLGKPSIRFDGTDDVLTIANSTSVDITNAQLLINSVCSASGGYLISKNTSAGTDNQYAIIKQNTVNGGKGDFYLENSLRQFTAIQSMPSNIQFVYSATFTTGVQKGYVNGANSGNDGNYNGTLTSKANMNIGARSNNAGGTAFATFITGYISEIIITSNENYRQKIEREQGKYYGLTVL